MSRPSRYILAAVLVLFTWMVLTGWDADSGKVRALDATLAAFMLLLALVVLAPRRLNIALRVVAGMVAVGYLAYFCGEVWALINGERQVIRLGAPSALMAGFGLLIFGVPALIYALGGVTLGWVARLFARAGSESAPDDPAS
jgi:hypothetical protein